MRTLEGFVIAQRFGSEADKDSLSFRKKAAPAGCFFFARERRDENPGGFVTAQRSAQQRLPVFPQRKKELHLILVT